MERKFKLEGLRKINKIRAQRGKKIIVINNLPSHLTDWNMPIESIVLPEKIINDNMLPMKNLPFRENPAKFDEKVNLVKIESPNILDSEIIE